MIYSTAKLEIFCFLVSEEAMAKFGNCRVHPILDFFQPHDEFAIAFTNGMKAVAVQNRRNGGLCVRSPECVLPQQSMHQ